MILQEIDQKEYLRLIHMHCYEDALWKEGAELIAGVDEAGRGPLAGPVVAAVVVLDSKLLIPGLNDSKAINPLRRSVLAREIKMKASGWGIGIVSVGFIEQHNIHEAALHAMRLAVKHLAVKPEHVFVDGCWKISDLSIAQTPIVKGDTKSVAIAAASILAKTTRDAIMSYYSLLYPKYGFARNKGYPTPAHLTALDQYGPCFIHRRTFRGVKGK